MALAHRRPYSIYRWLANTPRWLYQLGLGWVPGYRIMQLTHCGRKSGQIRQTILEVLHYDPGTREVLVVSGWEGKTDWYRNIQHEPALEVRIGRVQYRPIQQFLSPEETAQLILTLFRQRPREARLLGPLLGVDPDADEARLRARLETFASREYVCVPQKKAELSVDQKVGEEHLVTNNGDEQGRGWTGHELARLLHEKLPSLLPVSPLPVLLAGLLPHRLWKGRGAASTDP